MNLCSLWKDILIFEKGKVFDTRRDRLSCSIASIYEKIEGADEILTEDELRRDVSYFDFFCTNMKGTTCKSEDGQIIDIDATGKILQGGEIYYTKDKYGKEMWSWNWSKMYEDSYKDITFSNGNKQINVEQIFNSYNHLPGTVDKPICTVYVKQ